jgi:hypothetical protein
VRIAHLEKTVLNQLPRFSIWGAGRDGKKLFNNLKKKNQDKVLAFWDSRCSPELWCGVAAFLSI